MEPSNLTPGGPAVLRWAEIGEIETARATRRDHDFTKPGFVLQATAAERRAGSAEASLEDYAYATGVFAAGGEGQGLAASRLAAARATARRLVLTTNFAAGAGSRLSVTGPDIQGDWVVVQSHTILESSASGRTRQSHALTVVRADIPFRPRPWNKPRVDGVQTAFVVGDTPAGTVDTDEYGRVKVEFRWDRRDLGKGNPTRWVRVAQAWAGPGFGFVTLPRVGDEVLVAYSEGDPDMPLVVGRVHNAVSATPLLLPEPDKTKAIWKSQSFGPAGPVEGYNMVMMEDAAGQELLELRAQRDFRQVVLRHSDVEIGGNRSTTITGDGSTSVKGNLSIHVSGDCSLTADGALSLKGKTVDIEGTDRVHVKTGGERLDQSTNHIVRANAMYIQTKEVTQITGPRLHVFCDEIVLQAGGSIVEITKGGIRIESPGVVDVKGSLIKLNS